MKMLKKLARICLITAMVCILAVPTSITSLSADEISQIPDSVAVPALETAKRSSVFYGDLNYDSKVGVSDALMALQYSVGKVSLNPLTDNQIERGNVDLLGSVSIDDALLILQRSVYKINTFPGEKEKAEELLNTKVELKFRDDGTFRILQVSDLQDTDTLKPGTKERLEKMIDVADPDLVVFTGDNLWPEHITNEVDFRKYSDAMTELLEERGIAWCHVYGNHDEEKVGAVNNMPKEKQQEVYESYAYCVSRRGPEDIFGVGNYVVPIMRNDGKGIGFNVWCLDSGDYYANVDSNLYAYTDSSLYSSTGNSGSTYDFIKYNQQLWYYHNSTVLENYNGSRIPGAMFAHIALPEFWEVYNNRNDPSVKFTGSYNEAICCSKYNSHMFDTIIARGDVKGFYVGHDHMNTFSGIWNGIELGYDGALTTDNYGNYSTSPSTQGGRIFVINQDDAENYTSEFISYDEAKNGLKRTEKIGAAPFAGDIFDMEDGALPGFTASGWNGEACNSLPEFSVADSKGFKNSNALCITKDGEKVYQGGVLNRIDNCEIYFDVKKTAVNDANYLRIWADFSDVSFRMGSFGVQTPDGSLYDTDEVDGISGLNYYTLAEGSSTWKTYSHDNDGCFGSKAGNSLAGFKGWLAFPLKDFGERGSPAVRLTSSSEVSRVFFLFDFSTTDVVGNPFYLDQAGLVENYWEF